MRSTRKSHIWCLVIGWALICLLRTHGWMVAATLEGLSTGVGLLLARGSHAGLDAQIAALLESGQAIIKSVQLAWQQMGFGHKMAIVWGLRVFGPFFCLLLIALAQALPGAKARRQRPNSGDNQC